MINVNDNIILNPENVVLAEKKNSVYKLTLNNGKILYVTEELFNEVIQYEPGGGSGGTTVVANPTLTGDEDSLEGIQIGESKYAVKNDILHNYKSNKSVNIRLGLEKVTIPNVDEGTYIPVPKDATFDNSETYYMDMSVFEIPGFPIQDGYAPINDVLAFLGESPLDAETFDSYKDFLYTFKVNYTWIHPSVYDDTETYYRYSGGKYVPYPDTITPQIFDRLKNDLYIKTYISVYFPTKTGTIALLEDFEFKYSNASSSDPYDSSIEYFAHCSDWAYPSIEKYVPYDEVVRYYNNPDECPPLNAETYAELAGEYLIYIRKLKVEKDLDDFKEEVNQNKKYTHIISLQSNQYSAPMIVSIDSNSNTPFTSTTDVVNWLVSKGFTSTANKHYPVSSAKVTGICENSGYLQVWAESGIGIDVNVTFNYDVVL